MLKSVHWTKERKLFKQVTENTNVIAWATDENGLCFYLSPAWYEFTGQKLGDGTGFNWLTAVHPADVDKIRRGFFKSNDERTVFAMAFRLQDSRDTYRPVWDVGFPKFSDNGIFTGFYGTTCIIDLPNTVVDAAEDRDYSNAASAPRLTAREREIIELISYGNTTDTVASILDVATRTVESHLQNAGLKLNASNRTHIVATALRQKVI